MYDSVLEWEDRERERFPRPITQQTWDLLRYVGLFKFYEEATSLRGNSAFLQQFIHHWDHAQQEFRVGLDSWYLPMKDDIYFITELSRRGQGWPLFPEIPISIAINIHLIYFQRYVSPDIVQPTYFQVAGGQL